MEVRSQLKWFQSGNLPHPPCCLVRQRWLLLPGIPQRPSCWGVTMLCVAVIFAVATGILVIALGALGVLFKYQWSSIGRTWPECRASNRWRISCVDGDPSTDFIQLDEQLAVM